MKKRTYAPKKDQSTTKKRKIIPYTAPSKILLGKSLRTSLKYVEIIQLNPGVAGIPASYVFSANGLFDPNFTGVGHQPRGFDQLKVLFDHYIVMNSTIKVTFMSGASQSISLICGVNLQDDSTAEGNMIEAMENRQCAYGPLPMQNSSLTRSLKFNSNSFFSIKDRDLYGTAGSNPADQAWYVIFAQPTYGTDAEACDVMVEITYDAVFSEPNNPASS